MSSPRRACESARMHHMARLSLDSALWERFEEAARKRRRDPVRLLKELMKEHLELWEDKKLDRQVRKAALRSGRPEEEAVDLVRRHRSSSRPRATS